MNASVMPKFSIITVCRNEGANIRRTCESIIRQTYHDFEWIVIDGASTDGTVTILNEFHAAMSQMVSEPDGGIYDAMNKGIAKATGDYLVFMNGGDTFASPEVLEWVANSPQKEMIYGNIIFEGVSRKEVLYPSELKKGYLLRDMMPHQSTYFRRELFDTFGNYDTSFRIAADYDLYVRLLEIGDVETYHIAKPLAVFYLSGMSSSNLHRARRKQENHRIRIRHFPRYRLSLKGLRQSLRIFFTFST